MSALQFHEVERRARIGLKGPQAQHWLLGQGVELPGAPNTWLSVGDELLVARLGASEFFLEGAEGGPLKAIESSLVGAPSGVYPVLREDAAFHLSGDGAHDVLAQVCNINFAEVPLASRGVIMTLMIGVAVLVVPHEADGERRYRIWCDPSFGPYLASSLSTVVMESGGKFTGVST